MLLSLPIPTKAGLDSVDFKLMPYAKSSGTGLALFYSDLVGINAGVIARGLQVEAVEMANVLSSTLVMVASLQGENGGVPQYLMPVRASVFGALGAGYPLYDEMYELVATSDPSMLKLGAGSRAWLTANKSAIRSALFKGVTCESGW